MLVLEFIFDVLTVFFAAGAIVTGVREARFVFPIWAELRDGYSFRTAMYILSLTVGAFWHLGLMAWWSVQPGTETIGWEMNLLFETWHSWASVKMMIFHRRLHMNAADHARHLGRTELLHGC
ncbi:MAG: hypothetical protein AAFR11_05680 [Pseudomonadota bacterium]